MAVTQVATQVTTKRLFNIMSSGQSLMRSVYYSRQTSSKFLWQKQKEIFSMVGSVSRRWSSSSSVAEGAASNAEDGSSVAPPAVDADTRSYGSVQENPHEVASSSHEDDDNRSDDQEKLSDTGYDMSKVSKPAGGE